MSRNIDADKLIEAIGCSADLGGMLGKVVECVKLYAKHMVATAPTVNTWIPCSERLPEYDEEVLCFTSSEEMVVGHIEDEWGQNVWTTGEFASGTFDALAWMPLPEPWKGEGDAT